MTLEGQVALITGGSHGLGLSIARALGARGARIACVARAGAKLDAAVASLGGDGIETQACPADVTVSAQVGSAVEATLRKWGRIDLLVLNAGTWKGAKLAETTEELWDELVDLNLKGAFLTLRHALPSMIAAKRGTVVGISSSGGLIGSSGAAAYAASKWGLRGLLESAALELKEHGIRVSILHPHNINSAGKAIAPASAERARNLEPSDIAELIAFIATAPEYVAIGNVTIWPIAAGIGLR